MYIILIYIYTLNPRKNQVVQELARQNETEWGKRSNEKYNRFLKRRNKEEIQWQIDLFESEKCKRKLKTTKPKIKKQLDQNHSIPLSQIEIPIILEPLQQQKPPIQKNLLHRFLWLRNWLRVSWGLRLPGVCLLDGCLWVGACSMLMAILVSVCCLSG